MSIILVWLQGQTFCSQCCMVVVSSFQSHEGPLIGHSYRELWQRQVFERLSQVFSVYSSFCSDPRENIAAMSQLCSISKASLALAATAWDLLDVSFCNVDRQPISRTNFRASLPSSPCMKVPNANKPLHQEANFVSIYHSPHVSSWESF